MRRALLLAALVLATPAAAQQEIRFARGAASAVMEGAVPRGERATYSLGARAGQTMTLRIAAPEDNAVFQIYAPGARITPDGVAGTALKGAGEGEDARQWQGVLPADGRYLIVVGATRGNATYRLQVAIR
ncbi:hypothetical protein [Falsiroseomonas oryzae]|uniref:hypothetical protein n=1 Tax=Falsiroseomonas oryzae TaxID=2766473 RepID=UPI0022EAC510|nr:hypothetical protein [Roseomonas sp. MO-31]